MENFSVWRGDDISLPAPNESGSDTIHGLATVIEIQLKHVFERNAVIVQLVLKWSNFK